MLLPQRNPDIEAPQCPRSLRPMPHLLLVDDDEDILSLLTTFFCKHGHTVSVAEDGEAMFAALEKHPIDLIILDVFHFSHLFRCSTASESAYSSRTMVQSQGLSSLTIGRLGVRGSEVILAPNAVLINAGNVAEFARGWNRRAR